MTIYEVNLTIKAARAEEFVSWLQEHVQEMLKFPGFESARICHLDEGGDVSFSCSAYCVYYLIQERSQLDAYLEKSAGKMRHEGQKLFGPDLKASRRILTELSFLPDEKQP